MCWTTELIQSLLAVSTSKALGSLSNKALAVLVMAESKRNLQRVDSRDTVTTLRSHQVISPGGSPTLHLQTSSEAKRLRKSNTAKESLPYITSIIQDLHWALLEINGGSRPKAQARQLEVWGCFLDRQLNQASRDYHSVAHVFEISAGAAPLQVLATLFRDALHYTIDEVGLASRSSAVAATEEESTAHLSAEAVVQGFLVPGTHTVAPDLCERDRLVARIFGFSSEQDLSGVRGWHKGLDICMSAVLATRLLKDCLTLTQIAQLCVCMEATIPYRLREDLQTDQLPLEALYQRLVDVNQEFSLGLTHLRMIHTVQLGCDLWNRQVGNLVSDSLAMVLDHSWKLMPELNPALRKRALYKLNDYHLALQSMTNILTNMKASHIIATFRGIPTDEETAQFEKTVAMNLERVVLYMNARLLSVAVVAALACLTGGDAPKSFFFGDVPLPHETEVMDSMGQGLLEEHDRIERATTFNAEVHSALSGEIGMSMTSSFDTQQAPLAAYLYQTLGDVRIAKILADHKLTKVALPLSEEAAWALLRGIPQPVIITVAEEVGRFTVSRAPALERILPQM